MMPTKYIYNSRSNKTSSGIGTASNANSGSGQQKDGGPAVAFYYSSNVLGSAASSPKQASYSGSATPNSSSAKSTPNSKTKRPRANAGTGTGSNASAADGSVRVVSTTPARGACKSSAAVTKGTIASGGSPEKGRHEFDTFDEFLRAVEEDEDGQLEEAVIY